MADDAACFLWGFVWAVVLLDEPTELDRLCTTRELAEERARELGGKWQAERWAIQGPRASPT